MAKKLTTVELWYLLKYHPEESVRISAGNKAVEIYVQEGDYWGLEDLLEDDRVPEDVRILAGNKLGELINKWAKLLNTNTD